MRRAKKCSSPVSGVQRSGDARGHCLIGCPLPNSSIEQWRTVARYFLQLMAKLKKWPKWLFFCEFVAKIVKYFNYGNLYFRRSLNIFGRQYIF